MKKILTLSLAISLLVSGVVYAHSNKFEDVTICHATGSQSKPYVTIHTSPHAINGHFENNGTQKSGHEGDLLFEGTQECPTGDNGGGGGCTLPNTPSDLVVDTGVLNDHTVLITWGSATGGTVQINYSWDENNLSLSTTTENDGSFSLTGLTNGIHYWFQLVATNGCGNSGASVKIDPLP